MIRIKILKLNKTSLNLQQNKKDSIMIQRIQSIYLFNAALTLLALFIPVLSFGYLDKNFKGTVPTEGILADASFKIQDDIILMAIAVLGALLSIATILLYNNRILQVRLTTVIMVITLGLIIYSYYIYYTLSQSHGDLVFGFAFICPIITMVFLRLALYRIRKDENTVKNMDRLR
jgi:hypothetical protein